MKTAILALSFFAFAFITTPITGITATAAAPEPVLDISGQKLRTGVNYYILPVIRGRGGGLLLANSGNNTCPLYVVQETKETFSGQPVTFSPYDAKNGVIFTSSDLNIKSFVTETTSCDQSTVWKLLKVLTGVWFLSSGGVEGNSGAQPETIVNWFKIEKAEKDYELSFCPSVCKCQTLCRSLGIYIGDDGKRHLALSDKVSPFRVMFKRA
ncbi:hypothetical protein L6164_006290 [Bauhinia variegata]|uniref:Uncharacterized protein n=1 Tax=Bauhinia variegata TaxID=167791 RepID=A0ACB9PTV7_BAUVA|nr:hypothetical protein L6164_006290 [Bauhinia variegata]